jgi:hypothetical protein
MPIHHFLTQQVKALGSKKRVTYKVLPCGCHVTTSHSRSKEGTPHVKISNTRHHFQLMLWGQNPIPQNTIVTESCSTRGCINPDHLAALGHRDIILARGKHKKGSQNGRAKLTESDVAIIKASPETPQYQLAQNFGVQACTIKDILAGKTWKSVPPGDTPFGLFQRPIRRKKDKKDNPLSILSNPLNLCSNTYQATLANLSGKKSTQWMQAAQNSQEYERKLAALAAILAYECAKIGEIKQGRGLDYWLKIARKIPLQTAINRHGGRTRQNKKPLCLQGEKALLPKCLAHLRETGYRIEKEAWEKIVRRAKAKPIPKQRWVEQRIHSIEQPLVAAAKSWGQPKDPAKELQRNSQLDPQACLDFILRGPIIQDPHWGCALGLLNSSRSSGISREGMNYLEDLEAAHNKNPNPATACILTAAKEISRNSDF